MPSELVAVTSDAHDPAVTAAFWAALLGRGEVDEADAVLLPGDQTQVGLRFAAATTERSGPNQLHFHVTSTSADDQQHTVDTAIRLGARHLDVGQLPEEGHVVLADPNGDEFCVIGPGSNFLAGCGRLGEIACDGTRDVGLFWHRALGWPLVWDRDEETAVQSPRGGTKIAWGGPPLAPKPPASRQRFDLAASDLRAEVDRLVGLGATELAPYAGGVVLADPDGNEFHLASR
ncbi:MAG: VOC family protein [Nocardioides sp.]|nr:VOC family protein [Nocardioides sp.]